MPNTDYTPWDVSPRGSCQLSDFDTEPPAKELPAGSELEDHLVDMGKKLDKLHSSTPESPWYLVPADNQSYRDSFVAGLIVQTLENMKLKTPKPTFDPSKVKLA